MEIKSPLLIIESDPTLRQTLEQTAGEAEIPRNQIQTASTPEEAQAKLTGLYPLRAVLIDVQLGQKDGLLLLQNLRGAVCPNQNVPVIVLDSEIDSHRRNFCSGLNVSDYLPKPFDLEELIEALKKLKEFTSSIPK